MDYFKICMEYGTLREVPIPTTTIPQTPHGICRNEQPVGSKIIYTSTWYMLWDSGCTNYFNPYFELYTQYKSLDKGRDTEVNGIGGIIKPKFI